MRILLVFASTLVRRTRTSCPASLPGAAGSGIGLEPLVDPRASHPSEVDQLGPSGTAAAAGVQDAGVARAATGNPWWFDSLDVADGPSYEIAFVADNAGIRADHRHRLEHAADGLLTHLAHVDVSTPYRVGGEAGNSSE